MASVLLKKWALRGVLILVGAAQLVVFVVYIWNALIPQTPGWTTYTASDFGLTSNHVRALAIDGQGRVWVGTSEGLSVRGLDGSWKPYPKINLGLASNDVRSLAVDSQNQVWVGTFKGGLSVLAPDDTWTTYTPDNSGLTGYGVWPLVIDQEGKVWMGAYTGGPGTLGVGLNVLATDGTWTTYNSANSKLRADDVEALTIDGQGRVLVGTVGGLSLIPPSGTWGSIVESKSGLVSSLVQALTVDQQGQVWMGTRSGLSVLAPGGHWTTYKFVVSWGYPYYPQDSDDLVHIEYVSAVAVDARGRVFVGTWYDGLSVRTTDGCWKTYRVRSGLASNEVSIP